MKRHLIEDELIKYQFELLTEEQSQQVREHLEFCGRCRERLESLKKRFAALDVLRKEGQVPPELMAKAVAAGAKPARAKVISFPRAAWLSAAAVLLVAAGVLLVQQATREASPRRELAKETAPVSRDIVSDMKQPAKVEEDFARRGVGEPLAAAEARSKESMAAEAPAGAHLPKGQISQAPPFAPASAIELVTLPKRDKVQLTIYNSADLTLVRERRNLTLNRGWNWLQFMWANTLIDPTSLSLEPLEQAEKIDIQQLVYPPRLKDIGRWLIRSEVEGQVPFEITYFTSGLTWRAFYMGTLSEDERSMQLKSYVRVSNGSGEDYEDAQTRLIVGKVHILDQIAELARQQWPYGRPGIFGYDRGYFGIEEGRDKYMPADMVAVGGALYSDEKLERKEIIKEGLSEYFLYTIEGTETIPNEWAKRLLSFQAKDIKVKSLYKYDEERWAKKTIRYVSFVNDKEHNLGETPLPDGTVKIFAAADDKNGLSYVGGTSVKYIPVDEEVEMNLGGARLVKVEPKLMNFRTNNYIFDPNGNIAGWDVVRDWQIEVTNARQIDAEVEITRRFNTPRWTLEMDDKAVNYEKHDATHARFKVQAGPRSKLSFNYTVTTYWERRSEWGPDGKPPEK